MSVKSTFFSTVCLPQVKDQYRCLTESLIFTPISGHSRCLAGARWNCIWVYYLHQSLATHTHSLTPIPILPSMATFVLIIDPSFARKAREITKKNSCLSFQNPRFDAMGYLSTRARESTLPKNTTIKNQLSLLKPSLYIT